MILAGASHGGGSGARNAGGERRRGRRDVSVGVLLGARVLGAVDGERRRRLPQLDLDPAETTMSVAS